MATCVCEIALTERPLQSRRAARGEGAVVEFFGNVRPAENGAPIRGLEYEAHRTMAEHQLRAIAEEAVAKFALLGVTLHHRIGFVAAGETSLYLSVASLHRGAAFAASQWIVDELKKRVPIWKKPVPAELPAACHAGRQTLSESEDPVAVSLKISPRDPSTSPV